MPYTFYIEPDLGCVFAKSTGKFELDIVSQIFSKILNHPQYEQGMNILRDFSEVTVPKDISYQFITQENKRRYQEVDQHLGNCRLALLVRDAQSYAKVHQFIVSGRLSTNPVERKLFRDIGKAREWIDIPEDYVIHYPED